MPRTPKEKRSPQAEAIRRFRIALGDTQQQFAARMGLSITSVARYETNWPPSEEVLRKCAEVAQASGLSMFAAIFDQSLPAREPLRYQEVAACKHMLTLITNAVGPEHLSLARFAIALLTLPLLDVPLPPETEEILERVFGKDSALSTSLALADADIATYAAALVASAEPEKEREYIEFLRQREMNGPEVDVPPTVSAMYRLNPVLAIDYLEKRYPELDLKAVLKGLEADERGGRYVSDLETSYSNEKLNTFQLARLRKKMRTAAREPIETDPPDQS